MAGRVEVVGPGGVPGSIDESELEANETAGGHVASQAEIDASTAAIAQQRAAEVPRGVGDLAADYGDSIVAGEHALQRGIGEAVGLPLDKGITSVAELFGGPRARKSAAAYLKGLDDRHPYLTAATGLEGNVAGAVGAAVALKAPGAIGRPLAAGARGVASRMAVGGIENVVQATTKEINESALGDKAVNGQKLVADLPKHFLVGSLLTGGFEGVAGALGAGTRAFARKGVPVLEEGATRALGRELGQEGEEALAAGARVRDLHGGEIPKTRGGLADILTAEQEVLRGKNAAEHAGVADALAGTQQGEAAGLVARQEAARKAAVGAERSSIEAAHGAAAEETFEAAARGGERVESAELAGAARRAEARGASEAANEAAARAPGAQAIEEVQAGARQQLNEVAGHYNTIAKAIVTDETVATKALKEIAAEQADVAKDLRRLLKEIGDGADGAGPKGITRRGNRPDQTKGALLDSVSGGRFEEAHGPGEYAGRRFRGGSSKPTAGSKMAFAQRDPLPGDLNVETGETWTAEGIALAKGLHNVESQAAMEAAEASGSAARLAEAERLAALQESLASAHKTASEHLAGIQASRLEANEAVKAVREEVKATAKAQVTGLSKEAAQANKAAELAAQRVKDVEAETAAFIEEARGKGAKEVSKAEKRGAARIESAIADASDARAAADTLASNERTALGKAHEAQTKALPAASDKTSIDPLIEGMKRTGQERGARPAVSNGALFGAGVSLMHGNPLGAAAALGLSFAAGHVRNAGNLSAARAMRALSNRLSAVDQAVRQGAANILGTTLGKAAKSAELEREKHEGRAPKFEELAERLVAIQANPLELEHRVREAVGHVAGEAPGTYGAMLVTAQRAHAYLFSILPMPQRDPNSLTPHLEVGDVSDTAQYEFMESARAIDDPLGAFRDVEDGAITQAQVLAIQAVYPEFFDEMRAEVRRQTMYLAEPVEYDRSIHVGTLLGMVTNEVLEPGFQVELRKAYEEKFKKSESTNESQGASGSKAASNMMSASQSIEQGGTP